MSPENDFAMADDRVVVGYFSNTGDASRAIDELIDEGFRPQEIGAAFRSTGQSGTVGPSGGGRVRGGVPENPEVSGSIGGAGSHDEAVTPAGLAPGSGNAFPSAARPGPMPGGEIPSTLHHELKHDLPSTLAGETANRPMQAVPGGRTTGGVTSDDQRRRERLRRTFGENTPGASGKRGSNTKFGTGEGHLFPDYEYSENSFEGSFVGMGLGAGDARVLSNEMRRGGAVLSVAPGKRASLAEGIIERNHGQVRFESISGTGEMCEGSCVELYGRMLDYYRPEEARRKAS